MKIAITGAFSYSGKYIARRLLARGEEIVTLTGHTRRDDPFEGRIRAFPLDFGDTAALAESLAGVRVLVNTYWIRFDRGQNTQARAVQNTRLLVRLAREVGVQRLVHVSITNPSPASSLQYFAGKAAIEEIIEESGISYAILRPTVIFGAEDILVNNMAYLLRRFPFFLIPGDGQCRLQPIFVEDLAELAVEAVYRTDDYRIDAVGPEVFSFRQLVDLLSTEIGRHRLLILVPPRVALWAAQLLSIVLGDVLLTPQEITGLLANLLISEDPPRGNTRLSHWLRDNRASIGLHYASELRRHY